MKQNIARRRKNDMDLTTVFTNKFDFSSKSEFGEFGMPIYFLSGAADDDARKYREYAAQIDLSYAANYASWWQNGGDQKDLKAALRYAQRVLSTMRELESPKVKLFESWVLYLASNIKGKARRKEKRAQRRKAHHRR